MKQFFIPAFVFILVTTFSYGQVKQSADTIKPLSKVINAGFDVIIKKNGDILYGLVKQVGPEFISYQRTDIPDGPVYIIKRDDVYAISYRNQVKDVINPKKDSVVHDTLIIHEVPPPAMHDSMPAPHDTVSSFQPPELHKANFFADPKNFRGGDVRISLGFLRSYTKVSRPSQYASHVNFPVFTVAYDIHYKDQLRFGIQAAYGHHKFTGQQYSSYDSTQTAVTLNEYIFMIDVYARYNLIYHTSRLQPYIIGGLGIHNSHINSSYNVTFINDLNHTVQVNSGNNSVGIGLIARVGADYLIDRNTKVFGDAGIGPSVINLGVSLRID